MRENQLAAGTIGAAGATSETRGNAETLTQYIERTTPDLFKPAVVGKLEELRQQYQAMKDHPDRLSHRIAARYKSIRGQTPMVAYNAANKQFEVSIDGTRETMSLDEALTLFETTRIENEIYQDVYHVPPSLDSIQMQTQEQRDARRRELLDNFTTYLEPLLGQQSGYWEHFLGNEDIPPNYTPNGRLYFNPYAAYVPQVMANMLVAVADRNRTRGGKKIALQAKILNHDDLYPHSTIVVNESHDSLRPDKIVFYFSAEDVEEIFKIAQEVHRKVTERAHEDNLGVPVFSKRRPLLTGQVIDDAGNVLDGVGFAEEPPQVRASFGEIVSGVLAQMIAKSDAPLTQEYIQQHIGRELVAFGLSPNQPYLFKENQGSKFTGAARTVVTRHVKDFWG